MKDQIIVSKINGECAVAIPLFRLCEDKILDRVGNYIISFNSQKPVAYAVDMGDSIQLINAEYLEENVHFIGEL